VSAAAEAASAEQAQAPAELSADQNAVIEAAVKANVEALGESARNRDRWKNIIAFFVCFAIFKQAVDGDLF